ncbi:MAG TPA: divalent-cation tolerance protein CutA [Candidatus Sulfotelmatobacter sp.]|jgi:periplasmic divalent cation tolerance protein|nr:divalent-cation tolerance protein CutA [Candidatus Sulfotelmatobacter sp.]
MTHCLIYATAANRQQALEIGRVLVTERLVACANVVDGATSLYWWDGAVQEEAEALLLAKTTLTNVSAATAKILELHSYSTPCVTVLPIAGGNPAFLDWISRETVTGVERAE